MSEINEKAITRFLAEKAMGWREKNIKYASGGTYAHWIRKDGSTTNYRIGEFSPLDSIAHAFTVVDEMINKGYDIEIQTDEKLWRTVLIGGGTKDEFIFHGNSKKLPKAISIAAFRALATPEQIKSWL